jgi:hypothetical protein
MTGDVQWPLAIGPLVLLLVLLSQVAGASYIVEISEDGPYLPPMEDSLNMTFESSSSGDHYLISGYGHAGEHRVLDGDMTTVQVVRPPGEGFIIRGCTFSDMGVRLLAWGRGAGEDNDTVHLFDVPSDSFTVDFMQGIAVPFMTIDHARIVGGEEVLVVAGRDGKGNSTVLCMEIATGTILQNITVPGNRTVIHSDVNINYVLVIDEAGGVLMIDTFRWRLDETVPPMGSPLTAVEAHDGRYMNLATEDGTVYIGFVHSEITYNSHRLDGGPPLGAVSNVMKGGQKFMVTARPGDGGGSILEVWFTEKEEWELVHQEVTQRPVSFIHHVPGRELGYIVGYEDGSVVQYSVRIRWTTSEPHTPLYVDLSPYLIGGAVVVVTLLLIWRWRRRG